MSASCLRSAKLPRPRVWTLNPRNNASRICHMTQREQKLVKTLLDVLHESDGLQYEEITLHGEIYSRIACSLGEFKSALTIVSQRGWVNSVENRTTKKMKWNINDAGEAARLEF